ncbi:protein Wnt-16-like [Tachypleus tridentatus]|uniref:protein Wnt-16-like n=1 Tax=Tachypleus tridentatus TaxID=6853 RepID=UPI003FCF57DE
MRTLKLWKNFMLDKCLLWITMILILAFPQQQVSGNWMYLAIVGVTNPELGSTVHGVPKSDQPLSPETSVCALVPDLVPKQIQICKEFPDAIKAVSAGAKLGILECQRQFRHERWNCTPEGGNNVFQQTLERGIFVTQFYIVSTLV